MPSERRFRDDGTKATRSYKPDDGDDQMNEKDEDIVHAGIVSKSQKPRNSGRFCNSPRNIQLAPAGNFQLPLFLPEIQIFSPSFGEHQNASLACGGSPVGRIGDKILA